MPVRGTRVSRGGGFWERNLRDDGKTTVGGHARVGPRTGRLVGLAVASVTSLLDLELTVIAGSVALGFGASVFRRRIERACRQVENLRSLRVQGSNPQGSVRQVL